MTQQISYDPFDFLAQAEADFDVGNRPNGFPEFGNRALTIRNLSHFYAKSARDEHYRRLKKYQPDLQPTRFVLKNQLEKYQSFGVDGRGWRDVYYVQTVGI